MSLSSSIEFESRSRPYRGEAISSDSDMSSSIQHHRRDQLPPPRIRYPVPDYEDDEEELRAVSKIINDGDHENVLVINSMKKTVIKEENYSEAPLSMRPLSIYDEFQQTLPSEQLSGTAPASIGTSVTTRSTVPYSIGTTSSMGDENLAMARGGEKEFSNEKINGTILAVNGDDDGIEDGREADGFVMVTESDTTNDVREPDRFGFLGGSGKEVKVPVEVFRRRETKWLAMLGNWQFYMTKRFDKVRERCRKGIPSSLRPRAWKYLCGAQFFMTSSKTKNIFESLDQHPGDPHWNSEIIKDLNRQFPNHEMFSQATLYGKFGQEDLFRVLKAWTLLHPEEGYCQAQAPIAAALLMHMPAHEAFYCFAQICQKYLPGYYSPGLEAVQLDGDILFGLLKKHSYSSYKHLKKHSIDPVLYMVEWFMCIFCRTLPWPCVLRVLDMFFCEGVKILFKVGVFLFKYGLSSRDQLRDCPSMYETVERLRHLPIENLNEEYLVQKVAEMNITDEDLERVHYKQVKARNKKQKQQRSHVTM